MTELAYDMYFKEAILKHIYRVQVVEHARFFENWGQSFKMLFLTQVMQIVKLSLGMSNKFLGKTKGKCKEKKCWYQQKKVGKKDWLGLVFSETMPVVTFKSIFSVYH